MCKNRFKIGNLSSCTSRLFDVLQTRESIGLRRKQRATCQEWKRTETNGRRSHYQIRIRGTYVRGSFCSLKQSFPEQITSPFYTWKWKHISIACVFYLPNQIVFLCSVPSLRRWKRNPVSRELFYGLCCD